MDFKTYDQNSYKQNLALVANRRFAHEDITSRYSFADSLLQPAKGRCICREGGFLDMNERAIEALPDHFLISPDN